MIMTGHRIFAIAETADQRLDRLDRLDVQNSIAMADRLRKASPRVLRALYDATEDEEIRAIIRKRLAQN